MAPGQPGRLLSRRGRHRGEPRRLRAPRGQPRRERLPQVRFVTLVENGTHILFGTRPGRFEEGETTLAREALAALRPGMLCLADRQFFGHALWQGAAATGADLLWRVKRNLRLPRGAGLPAGPPPPPIHPRGEDRRPPAHRGRVGGGGGPLGRGGPPP